MKDIADFAQQAAAKFLESQNGINKEFDLELDGSTVNEFIRTAFYASLIPDEGRFPSVSLMSYRKEREAAFHHQFHKREELTAEKIAKLAHAVAADSHICCVSDRGKIVISGFHVNVLNEMRESGYSSSRIANPLKVVIRGPGHIEMSTGGIALSYKAGQITEENLLQHSSVMKALCQHIASELKDLTTGSIESIEDIFNDLTEAIIRLGHGGIILVAEQPCKSQFTFIREVDHLLLQQLLIRYWNDVNVLLEDTGGSGNFLARIGIWSPHSLTVASDTAMLEKCIGSIAQLAGMDGAIVMQFDCRVVGFNAIIAKAKNNLDMFRLVDPTGRALDYDDVVKNRGSRHQSALSYAMQVAKSFAFVISQDGSVSAYHNSGKEVVCESEMRVLD